MDLKIHIQGKFKNQSDSGLLMSLIYTLVLPFYTVPMVLSYSRVSTVCKYEIPGHLGLERPGTYFLELYPMSMSSIFPFPYFFISFYFSITPPPHFFWKSKKGKEIKIKG